MGVDKANWTPHVSATRHHGQGDGTGYQWAFRLHWVNESIDEVVDMSPSDARDLVNAYRNNNPTAFATAFHDWLSGSSASSAAKALESDFRVACWAWLDGGLG